jgi:hypothetical protein
MYDLKTVNKISHSAEIRNILLKHETNGGNLKLFYQIKAITPNTL